LWHSVSATSTSIRCCCFAVAEACLAFELARLCLAAKTARDCPRASMSFRLELDLARHMGKGTPAWSSKVRCHRELRRTQASAARLQASSHLLVTNRHSLGPHNDRMCLQQKALRYAGQTATELWGDRSDTCYGPSTPKSHGRSEPTCPVCRSLESFVLLHREWIFLLACSLSH